MKHPNAFAALIAGAAVYGAQWLVYHYGHTSLDDSWRQTITVGTTAAVLWVGREGIRGALKRLWGSVKAVWTGAQPPA